MKTWVGAWCVAAVLLAGCGSSRTVRGYIGDLKSENVLVQSAAVDQLGKLEDTAAVAPLCDLLKRTDSRELRLATMIALGRLGDAGGADALMSGLDSPDAEVRMRATEALGRMKASKALEAVARRLEDEEAQVKLTAIWALGNMADRRAVPLLTALVDSSDEYVRYNARRALQRIGEGH